ncbi:hypothetical protein P5673_009958 [Acropora cervicornis]|uniref:Uncharacterized protein n=1 Tax=Acropora cervicornis TaxID=6130 RepID=A0AAD9QS94_ACRCE|nr:hypothetical protein P5673_009958 [Acropora cervicornis]
MTQWTEHASAELAIASKPELIRKLFEKTGCLPNTDLDQATRTEFTFVLDNELETLCEDHSGDYHYTCSDWPSMESQMVTAYFNQAQQQKVNTFNTFQQIQRLESTASSSRNERFFLRKVFLSFRESFYIDPIFSSCSRTRPSRSSSITLNVPNPRINNQRYVVNNHSNTVNKVLFHNAIEPCVKEILGTSSQCEGL